MTKRKPHSPDSPAVVTIGLTFGHKQIRMAAPVDKFECSEEAPGGRAGVSFALSGKIVHLWADPIEFLRTIEAGIEAQRRRRARG